MARAHAMLATDMLGDAIERTIALCSFCGKVRNKFNQWQLPAEPIDETLGAKISHGICPACFEENYGYLLAELND